MPAQSGDSNSKDKRPGVWIGNVSGRLACIGSAAFYVVFRIWALPGPSPRLAEPQVLNPWTQGADFMIVQRTDVAAGCTLGQRGVAAGRRKQQEAPAC